MTCDASITRAGGEVVRCERHSGPWHVGWALLGDKHDWYTWPREPVRAFPLPRRGADDLSRRT